MGLFPKSACIVRDLANSMVSDSHAGKGADSGTVSICRNIDRHHYGAGHNGTSPRVPPACAAPCRDRLECAFPGTVESGWCSI